MAINVLGITKVTVEMYTPPARNHRLAGHIYVEGSPARKRVYLFERWTGALITGTFSDSVTGEWLLKGLPDYGSKNLLVTAFDDTDTYNAEVADCLTQIDGDY